MLATKFSYKFPKVGEPIFTFNTPLPQPADLNLVFLGIGGELLDLVEEPRGQEQSTHGRYGGCDKHYRRCGTRHKDLRGLNLDKTRPTGKPVVHWLEKLIRRVGNPLNS